MEEIGKVSNLEDGIAKVEMSISDHCKHCSMAKFCIVTEGDKREIMAKDPIGVKVGDVVKIRTSGGNQLSSIFLVFGLPILLGVIGLFLGASYGDKQSLIGGIIGLGIGLIILKIIEKFFAKQKIPEIIEICKEEE